MSEEYRDLFITQSKWIERIFTQNETVIKSLIEALNTLSQMRSTSTCSYLASQLQQQSPFNLFRNPFAPVNVNNGSPGLVPLNNIPDPYNFILDNDNGLVNNSNTPPIQPPSPPPHNPASFNPFKDMPPEEKNAVLTLFSNLPKIIEQKEKMEKDKEKEDKEWKDKLDRERTG